MTAPYPPLAEVRKNLRVEWYRCPIKHASLRELSKRSNMQGWFQTGGHLILFAATGSLTYYLWSEQLWLGFVVALFAHGTVGSFLAGVAPHELGHGTVFRTRWLNKFFLYFYSLLSWWDPFDYASSHTYHHRYTQYPDGDRENLLPLEPSVGATFLLQMFTVNLLTTPGRVFGKGGAISTVFITIKSALGIIGATEVPSREWMQALHTDQPDQARRSMWWSRFQLLFHATVAGAAIATDLWVLPLLLTLFPFIANWGVYFVGMTQHCGLRDNVPDFRKSVRSFTLNPFASFLYWRMNWHTEHHMYAGVPCYNLRNLYLEIAEDMPEPRTLLSAWREMRYTWNRQKTEPDYQFDTPLPNTTNDVGTGTPDELESSIGELAPVEMK
jgi:fatty acid desaturase